jgi:superfamily I DNA/RNA helicase
MSAPSWQPEDFTEALGRIPAKPIDPKTAAALDQVGQQDHSITNEYQLYGAPGCGKTTAVEYKIRQEFERLGPKALLITSFSKAAAVELAGRGLPIAEETIGTLHAHCYRALGKPKLTDDADVIRLWNNLHPQLRIGKLRSHRELTGDDPVSQRGDWLESIHRMRGLLLPMELWPSDAREIYARWQQFKQQHKVYDFPDLIDLAIENFKIAPGRPQALFIDEAQDLTPQQWKLLRQWGNHAEYFLSAGDDDQCIFSWTGASPRSLLDQNLPETHKVILTQSHRLPLMVHRAVNQWIRQLGARRQEKHYRPRDAAGSVEFGFGTWKDPVPGITDAIWGEITGGRTVMLLATCAYMLRPLLTDLSDHEIPFHNPYRIHQQAWNPLDASTPDRPVSILRALLGPFIGAEGRNGRERPWRARELAQWTGALPNNISLLMSGARERLHQLAPEKAIEMSDLASLFVENRLVDLLTAFEKGQGALAHWWGELLPDTEFNHFDLPLSLIWGKGVESLSETPKVIVGTIHSVKGGEADTVILFPDVSPASEELSGTDEAIRLFYVGMSRARKKLILAEPAGRASMAWGQVFRTATPRDGKLVYEG